jgi:hypothetical protein
VSNAKFIDVLLNEMPRCGVAEEEYGSFPEKKTLRYICTGIIG